MIIALKTIREAKGVGVDELAEKTGLTKMKIWNYESGRNQPDPEALCSLADALDVSLDMLVKGKEKDRPEGRPIGEMLNMYDKLDEEELELILAVINTTIARRRYEERRRQAPQE